MKLNDLKNIYFLGIGGIGMSALARYFNDQGLAVEGYDLVKTDLTKELESEGIKIGYADAVDRLPREIDLVVLTPAIPQTHKQLNWLKSQGIPIKKRAEVLGLLSKESKTIAVAGTHGKTTTSCLLAHMLTEADLKVTAFLGGLLAKEGTNYIKGSSDLVVLEADEYDRSFLHLNPQILVIISMDPDHLDIYGNVEEMYAAYRQLTEQIPEGGTLILGPGVYALMSIEWIFDLNKRKIDLRKIFSDFDYNSVAVKDHQYHFTFKSKKKKKSLEVSTNLPGIHNVTNSSLALEVGTVLGVSPQKMQKSISEFRGIKRRFETVYDGARKLIDDYAHHPEEVSYAVKTVKQLYPQSKILGVFQPHLYSRTKDFYRGFAAELSGLDGVLLMPIYPAREEPIEGIESEIIYNLMTIDDKELIDGDSMLSEIESRSDYDLVMTIGAADLDKYHNEIISVIKKEK